MLTESWCDINTLDCDIALPGYTLFRKDRASGRGGGCLIYTSSLLKVDYFYHSILNTVEDSIWITVSCSAFYAFAGCIYRAPNSTKHGTLNLINAFNLVADLPFAQKIIAGDFNMPDISWTTNSAPKNPAFLSTINVGGWNQIVKSPTRFHSTLDLIFTLNVHNSSAEVLDAFSGSDHKIVKCVFEAPLISSLNPARNKNVGFLNIQSHNSLSHIQLTMAYRPNLGIVDWSVFQTILRSLDLSIFLQLPAHLWLRSSLLDQS